MQFSLGITGWSGKYYQIGYFLTVNYFKQQKNSKFWMFIPSESWEFFLLIRGPKSRNRQWRGLLSLNVLCPGRECGVRYPALQACEGAAPSSQRFAVCKTPGLPAGGQRASWPPSDNLPCSVWKQDHPLTSNQLTSLHTLSWCHPVTCHQLKLHYHSTGGLFCCWEFFSNIITQQEVSFVAENFS